MAHAKLSGSLLVSGRTTAEPGESDSAQHINSRRRKITRVFCVSLAVCGVAATAAIEARSVARMTRSNDLRNPAQSESAASLVLDPTPGTRAAGTPKEAQAAAVNSAAPMVSSPSPLPVRVPDSDVSTTAAGTPEPLSASPAEQSGSDRHAEPSTIPPIAVSLSAEEIATLLARGDAFLSTGDFASARLCYERAADAGDAQAALRLGETYDPGFLARVRLKGARGDAVAAGRWYRYALGLGATEAEVLLSNLMTNEGPYKARQQ